MHCLSVFLNASDPCLHPWNGPFALSAKACCVTTPISTATAPTNAKAARMARLRIILVFISQFILPDTRKELQEIIRHIYSK